MKRYKKEEWNFKWKDGLAFGGFDDRIYIDSEGNPITGILEGFYGYTSETSDDVNCQYVYKGERK